MPRGRPKGSKNRVKSETGEVLPSLKEISSIAILGRSGGRGFELDFLAGLEQRTGILLPLPDDASITILPALAGRKLGDRDDDEGCTFCRFYHSDGYEAPCLYSERDGTAYIELIERKLALWDEVESTSPSL